MPTMANQLGLPELEQEAIGHWRKGSAMPQHYDALHCSLETKAKDRILTTMAGGFRPGKKGELYGICLCIINYFRLLLERAKFNILNTK